jgi:hypothetical protein
MVAADVLLFVSMRPASAERLLGTTQLGYNESLHACGRGPINPFNSRSSSPWRFV